MSLMVDDEVQATVEVVYSNIRQMWHASLIGDDGKTLAHAIGASRADALIELAEEITGGL
jgi:hypothetical protein